MSYRISITGKESYILIELFGDVSIQKIVSIDSFLYADSDYIQHPYAIWDFTECIMDIEIEHVVEFAQYLKTSRTFRSPGKAAFVTHDPKSLAIVAPVIELVNESTCQIVGFPTRVAAVQWITQ